MPAVVQADGKRLRQVLINLLGNAIKFTDHGSVTLTVEVISDQTSGANTVPSTLANGKNGSANNELPLGKIRFKVTDTGVGITSEQLEKIFLPFEQVGDNNHRAQGTGLGLTICRELAQAMGSDLQVESEIGRGSTFWMDLELSVLEMESTENQLPNRTVTGYTGPRRKILVVDDQPDERFVLANLLKPLGFELLEAEDGLSSITQAQIYQPDAILMNLNMPLMSGVEAVQKIRQLPELAGKPPVVIATSANAFVDDKDRGLPTGCDAVLVKPIAVEQLLTLLQTHLHLELIYEDNITLDITTTVTAASRTGEELLPPPQQELALLFDLALKGNMRAIRNRASLIKQMDQQYTLFANKLQQLALSYEEKEIRLLIERYRENGI